MRIYKTLHIGEVHTNHCEDFLIDNEDSEFDNFLDRKMRSLKDKWNHIVTDDLTIIRIKNDTKNTA